MHHNLTLDAIRCSVSIWWSTTAWKSGNKGRKCDIYRKEVKISNLKQKTNNSSIKSITCTGICICKDAVIRRAWSEIQQSCTKQKDRGVKTQIKHNIKLSYSLLQLRNLVIKDEMVIYTRADIIMDSKHDWIRQS